MKHNHFDPHVHALLSAAVDILGPEQVLPLIEKLVVAALSESESRSVDEGVDTLDSNEHFPVKMPDHRTLEQQLVLLKPKVLGLPDGYTWDEAPVEVKLAKDTLRSAMARPQGVVLRHQDSPDGSLYFAVFDAGTRTFRVPSGYVTSRGVSSDIKVNGGYRWSLVGIAIASKSSSRSKAKSSANAMPVTLPKWRGREYEPCHEEMAHTGNVRIGSLVRDTVKGTLDYVAAVDGKSALIERENGHLDAVRLTAEPSKLLRVVGFSSQYAQEVVARG